MRDQYTSTSEKQPIIIETFEGVLGDLISADELAAVIERSSNELLGMKNDFYSAVSKQAPNVRKGCLREIAAVGRLFDEYEDILGFASGYAESLDKGTLREAKQKLADVMLKLNRSFLEFRECALVALGPSSHSGINLLLNSIRRVMKGIASPGELLQAVSMQRTLTMNLIEHLRFSSPSYLTNVHISFNEAYLKTLDLFAPYSESKDVGLLDALFNSLEESGDYYTYIDINHLVRNYQELGPTGIPFANLIINCARLVKDGKMPREILFFIIQEIRNFILGFATGGEVSGPAETGQPALEEESGKLSDALARVRKTLDQYGEIALSGEFQVLSRIEQALVGATKLLEGSLLRIREYADQEGRIPCLHCGSYNAPGETRCLKCSMQSAAIMEERLSPIDLKEPEPRLALGGDGLMTVSVFRLFEAAEKLIEGSLKKEQFLRIIDEMKELISNAATIINKAPPLTSTAQDGGKGEVKPVLEEAYSIYDKSISDLKTGLIMFREFSGNPSHELKESAKETVWRAISGLGKMQKLLSPYISKKRK